MIVPVPNNTAIQGTSRPGPVSSAIHSRSTGAARPESLSSPSDQSIAGLGEIPAEGRQVATRPRVLPSPAIAPLMFLAPRPPTLGTCYMSRAYRNTVPVGKLARSFTLHFGPG